MNLEETECRAAVEAYCKAFPNQLDNLRSFCQDKLDAHRVIATSTLSPEHLAMCKSLGNDPLEVAEYLRSQKADEDFIASLPAERIDILQRLNPGATIATLASAERETRAYLKSTAATTLITR
jgi:hypothetical protein